MSIPCVALLRAVNVGGASSVPMARLRAFFEGLGFEQPTTVLQSGNVVFRAGARPGAALEARLEREAAARLSLSTEFFLRASAEWAAMMEANPFPDAAADDPSHLLVMCLKREPTPEGVAALRDKVRGRERIAADGRALYLVYPDGIHASKLTGALIEKTLGTGGTARNWNTVTKVAALLAAM